MKFSGIRQLILGAVAATTATGIVVYGAMAYQAGWDYTPTGENRALNVNQVVFPDGDKTSSQQQSSENNSELWQKDETANETDRPQQSERADYLFADNTAANPSAMGEETTNAGQNGGNQLTTRTVDLATGTEAGTTAGTAGTVYDVTGDTANADVILNGGSGTGTGTGEAEGPTPTPRPTPGASAEPIPIPNPGTPTWPGGATSDTTPDAMVDSVPTKPGPPSWIGSGNAYVEGAVSEDDDYQVMMQYSEAIYRGQTLTKELIYNSLATYILLNEETHTWLDKDYGVYIRVDAISFDGGQTWTDEFPIKIPYDLENDQLKIRMQYRLHKTDVWKDYVVGDEVGSGLFLTDSRVFVLKNRMAEGATEIDADNILYDSGTDSMASVNLLGWLSGLGSYLPNERLTTLFPGWMENGELVPWMYKPDYGRHILEPADSVPFDSDTYQVEKVMLGQWEDGRIDPYGFTPVYLQTLTGYTPQKSTEQIRRLALDDPEQDEAIHVENLTVPEYVQAVDVSQSELSVDYLELSDTVLYVDTAATADFLETGCLQVTKGYIVDENNPAYTAEDGLLYNKDVTALEWVDLPEDTTTIGYRAFKSCTALQGVFIGATDEILIETEAFADCTGLR